MSVLLVIASAALAAAPPVGDTSPHASPRAPPAVHCMDARAVVEARHLSPRMLLAHTGQGRFRIDLSETCPLAGADADVAVLAPQGWVCGGDNEFVRIAGRVCAIGGVTTIDEREFAQLTRASDGAHVSGMPQLQPIEVQPSARRGFVGSHDYCIDPRQVRGWDVQGDGLIVNTAPRHSGGNTWYRIELGSSCPELTTSQSMRLHSGVGIGWVCGNAGDMVRAVPASLPGGLGGRMLAAKAGCPITAVYPIDSLAGR